MVLPDRVALVVITIALNAAIQCFREGSGEEEARRYMENRRRKNLLEAAQGKVFRALRLSALVVHALH